MGARRQEQLVSPDAVQLPASHPRHDTGELRQLPVRLQRKRLHQGGETVQTGQARDKRHKHEKKRLPDRFGADVDEPPASFNSPEFLQNVTLLFTSAGRQLQLCTLPVSSPIQLTVRVHWPRKDSNPEP